MVMLVALMGIPLNSSRQPRQYRDGKELHACSPLLTERLEGPLSLARLTAPCSLATGYSSHYPDVVLWTLYICHVPPFSLTVVDEFGIVSS